MARTNSFGTFLETRQFLRGARLSALPEGDRTSASLVIFQQLAKQPRLEVAELLSSTGLEIEPFLAGLKSLEEAGLVDVAHDGDRQVVTITPQGESLRVA
jgi:predicted transcriptional regulator